MSVKHLDLEIYIGEEGINYYSFNPVTKVLKNREGIRINFEDIDEFKQANIKLRDPIGFLEFLADELGYGLYISEN